MCNKNVVSFCLIKPPQNFLTSFISAAAGGTYVPNPLRDVRNQAVGKYYFGRGGFAQRISRRKLKRRTLVRSSYLVAWWPFLFALIVCPRSGLRIRAICPVHTRDISRIFSLWTSPLNAAGAEASWYHAKFIRKKLVNFHNPNSEKLLMNKWTYWFLCNKRQLLNVRSPDTSVSVA